jgi:hypothetical protein
VKRTLTLSRETLAELSSSELAAVAGGAESGISCPLIACVETRVTCNATCTW